MINFFKKLLSLKRRTVLFFNAAVSGVGFLLYLRNDKQTLTLSGGGGTDTYTLTFEGETTGSILETASAATVQTALEALSNVSAGDIVVTGSAGGPYTLKYAGNYAGQDMDLMTGTPGGSLSLAFATTTPEETLLGGQQTTGMSLTVDKADITNKDSTDWEEALGTIRHFSMTEQEIVLDESEEAYDGLLMAYQNHKDILVRTLMPDLTEYTGIGHLDSLEIDGPNDGAKTATVSISGKQVLTKT